MQRRKILYFTIENWFTQEYFVTKLKYQFCMSLNIIVLKMIVYSCFKVKKCCFSCVLMGDLALKYK
jgi:hypothetical protein